MRSSKVSIIAVIAVMTMMFCSFIPAAVSSVSDGADQAEKQTYRYVSMGDSMSVGFGMTGYYAEDGSNQFGFVKDIEGTYPYMLTEYLREQLGSGYDVQHAQIGISGTRSVEWRALIDDDFTGRDEFPGDAYTKSYLSGGTLTALTNPARLVYPDMATEYPNTEEGNFAFLQDIYRTELANADLITYNSHYDFGYDIAVHIQEIASGGLGIDTDFTLYLEPEYVRLAESAKTAVMDYLVEYLAEQGIDISEYRNIIERIVTVTVYAIVSYCANFDAIMEYIFTVNPDAKVIVIDTYDMFAPFDVTMSGMTVSVSDLYDMILGIANPYVKYCSPYSLRCYHVDIDGSPMTFGNEFRDLARDQLSDDAKADLVYAAGLAEKAADPTGAVYYNTIDSTGGGNLSLFMKYIFSSHEVDAELFMGQDISKMIEELKNKITTAVEILALPFNKVNYNPDDGSCTVSINYLFVSNTVTFSKAELSMLWVYFYLMSGAGVMSHTSSAGHLYLESCIEAEIEKKNILFEESSVYISESDIDPSELPSDVPYVLYNLSMTGVRGYVTHLYMDWDEVVALINSDDYYPEYDKIMGYYAEWQKYIKTGLDDDLTDLNGRLVYLDQNWDTIFAGYTESETVIQLHAIVLNILNNWDDFKDAVKRLAVIMDQKFADIVETLEPATIRALLADKETAMNIHESLLNISMYWDSFLGEIYTAAISAETPEQLMESIDGVIEEYAQPCHKTKMYPAVEPGCYTDGCLEHYVCKECSSYLIQDESGRFVKTTEEGVILQKGHTLVEHEAEESTCIEHGNNLYYTCEKCTIVLKSDKTTTTTVEAETLPFSDHIHEKIPAVTPSKTHTGSTEGDRCSYCEKTLTEPQVIPATGTDDITVTSDESSAEFKVQDTDEIKSLSVKFDGSKSGVKSEISVPSGTVDSLKGKTVQFSVERSSKLTDAYEIDMTADGSKLTGEVYISIPYEASRGTPSVKWADDGSQMEVVSIDSSAGLVTFKTTHNSTYQVTYTAPASNDMTMIIVIAAIAVVLIALIAGVIIWKKRSKA